jgi:NitT/TauT family transport system substrate-binding protein
MKKYKLLTILLVLIILLSGCSNNLSSEDSSLEDENIEKVETEDAIDVTIAGLKGPTSIGMIKLIDEKALNNNQYNVNYVAESAPDSLTGKIINGEIQISSLPINLASIIFNKTEGEVQLLGLNTIGNLYIIGTEELNSIEDLKGKTIGMSAKGSTPDYAINHILKQNNLGNEVDLDYVTDHATLAQSVIAEDTKIALLPEPFVTQVIMKNKNAKILLDLDDVWNTSTKGKSELITGCIIANKKFAENNREFIDAFMKQYEESVKWVNQNPSDASILVEKNEIMPNANLVEKAIPNSGITFKYAIDAKEIIQNFYQILFDSNPTSIGGSLPNEDFYYSK